MKSLGVDSKTAKKSAGEILDGFLSSKRAVVQALTAVLGLALLVVSAFMFALKSPDALTYTFIGAGVAVLVEAALNIIHYQYLRNVESMADNLRLAELKSEIHETMANHFQSCVYKDKPPFTIHGRRNDIQFQKLIKEAKNRIIVMNTNASFICNYHSEIVEAVEKREVSFKLLTLNPKNLFIVTRYHELGLHTPKVFFDEITSSLNRMVDEGKRITNSGAIARYEVRLTTNQPTNLVFVIDDILIVGFIFTMGRSHEFIHLEFDLSQSVNTAPEYDFIRNFEALWEAASIVDLTDIPSDVDMLNLLSRGRDNKDNTYAHTYPEEL